MRNSWIFSLIISMFFSFFCFAAWTDMDIPTTLMPAGSAVEDPAGTWTVSGAGADIWGTSDEFHFLFSDEVVSDDAAISCHVVSLSGSASTWAKAGIMFRAEGPDFLGPESYAFCIASSGNGVCLQYRDGNGSGAARNAATTMVGPADVWLKLVRDGDTFNAYVSEHLPIWQFVDTNTFLNLLGADMYVGLAVTSHETGTLASAVFDNINLDDPGMSQNGPTGLSCKVDQEAVNMSWINNGTYKEIQVYRKDMAGDITRLTPGPGANDETFSDSPGNGFWTYSIVAIEEGDIPCVAQSCSAVIGADGVIDPNGFILSWLLLGPYAQAGGATPGEGEIMRDYLADEDGMITEFNWLPKTDDEVITDFGFLAASTGYAGGFLSAGYTLPTVQVYIDNDDTIDLNSLASVGDNDNVMAYAFAYINNPQADPIDAVIELACDDTIQVSLGTCAVFVSNVGGGYGNPGTIQNRVPVTIPPGPSRLMVKSFEGGGGWGFRLRFVDSEGNPITNDSDPALTVVLDPEQVGLTQLPDDSCIHAVITPDVLTPTCGQVPLDVTLDGLSSFSRGEIAEYTWDFGDGSDFENGDVVTHTFEDPGFYDVTLTVEDENGKTDSTTYTVNVFIQNDEWECDPPANPDKATLVKAFAFGSDTFTCATYNDPGVMYEKVSQSTLGLFGIEYDSDRGWGYEVTRPDATLVANGWGIYGPFDDSPNTRTKFPDTCPEQLYDEFIGNKNFTTPCMEPECASVAGTDSREGIHFIIDIPNGNYRFVGAFGDSDNVHAHTIIIENGGEGEEINMDNSVVLVKDFNQAQWCQGETQAEEPGEGVFARVGFDCKIPPLGDGIFPDPKFVNMDENGQPTFDPPNSPVLKVTEGYIRMHQLQGASKDGPGGTGDPNGGDAVILEVWEVEGTGPGEPEFIRGDTNVDGSINLADAITILSYLFSGAVTPSCLDSADANDDGSINLADAIQVLSHLFAGTGDLPLPFPDCGVDPKDDSLAPCVYDKCPKQ